MPTKKGPENDKTRGISTPATPLPDDFPADLLGEFRKIPAQTVTNMGRITGLVCNRGGYIGISTTDDGGSAKLVVRCASLAFERRIYRITDLDKLLFYCLEKLKE